MAGKVALRDGGRFPVSLHLLRRSNVAGRVSGGGSLLASTHDEEWKANWIDTKKQGRRRIVARMKRTGGFLSFLLQPWRLILAVDRAAASQAPHRSVHVLIWKQTGALHYSAGARIEGVAPYFVRRAVSPPLGCRVKRSKL